MAKIKVKNIINESESANIRRSWNNVTQEWNYSIADIIGLVTDSIDSRNYWKALKNRLKNSHPELVTACNQLKMEATDGKYYMIDAANRSTIRSIIELLAPYSVDAFESWFDHIEVSQDYKNTKDDSDLKLLPLAPKPGSEIDEEKISTALEAPIDVFEEKDKIIIKFLAPGIKPDDIFIAISSTSITIKGELKNKIIVNNGGRFLTEELSFGYFYRKIDLPNLANIEQIEATEYHGLIEIKITKIDKYKEKFIKIKSI